MLPARKVTPVKRSLQLAALLLFAALVMFASLSYGQTVAIGAANIQDINGNKLTSGRACLQGVNGANVPIGFEVRGGGQVYFYPGQSVCVSVTAGTFDFPTVPDTMYTNPVNVCYHITIKDTTTNQWVLGYSTTGQKTGYECLQPTQNNYWCTSGVCSFDLFKPDTPGVSLELVGPPGPPGPQGPPGTGVAGWLTATSYPGSDIMLQIAAAVSSMDCTANGCIVQVPAGTYNVPGSSMAAFSTLGLCPTIVGTPGGATTIHYTSPPTAAFTIGCTNFGRYGFGMRDLTLTGPGNGWVPSTAEGLNSYILMASGNDGSGNIYKVTTGGTSGTTEPDWSTCASPTDTCSDGTAVLTNMGPSVGLLLGNGTHGAANAVFENVNVSGFGLSEEVGVNSWGVEHHHVFEQTFLMTYSGGISSGETFVFDGASIFGGNVGLFTGKASMCMGPAVSS